MPRMFQHEELTRTFPGAAAAAGVGERPRKIDGSAGQELDVAVWVSQPGQLQR